MMSGMSNKTLNRNEAIAAAAQQADETLTARWIVRTAVIDGRSGEFKLYEVRDEYEVRDACPGDGADIYRVAIPSPVFDNVGNAMWIGTAIGESTYFLELRAEFVSLELAKEFASRFPKSAKVRTFQYDGRKTGNCHFAIKVRSDGTNKGTNEAGLKRASRVLSGVKFTIFDLNTGGTIDPVKFGIKINH